jgi:hypothetical protein
VKGALVRLLDDHRRRLLDQHVSPRVPQQEDDRNDESFTMAIFLGSIVSLAVCLILLSRWSQKSSAARELASTKADEQKWHQHIMRCFDDAQCVMVRFAACSITCYLAPSDYLLFLCLSRLFPRMPPLKIRVKGRLQLTDRAMPLWPCPFLAPFFRRHQSLLPKATTSRNFLFWFPTVVQYVWKSIRSTIEWCGRPTSTSTP